VNAQLSNESTIEGGIGKVNKIDITIDQKGFTKIEEELYLTETMGRILIPKKVENLLIYDSKGNELGYEILSLSNKEYQLLKFYLKSPKNRNVRISYLTQFLTRKKANLWTIKFYSPTTPRTTIIKVSFPENANVTSFRTNINQTIYLYPPSLKSPIFLYPQSNKIKFEFDYILGKGNEITQNFVISSIEILFIVIIIVVLMLIVLYFYYKKRKERESEIREGSVKEEEERIIDEMPDLEGEKKLGRDVSEKSLGVKDKKEKIRRVNQSVLNMLDENEKRIVKMLEDSEVEITQAYIYKTLGIPKASLSNIIKRLEQRNLIYKKKEGRINWIKLKEWVFE